MKRFWLSLLALALLSKGFTQKANILYLEDCYQAARKNAEIARRPDLYRQQSQVRTASFASSGKPSVNLNARASLQTENVDLGIESPLFSSPDLPLAQYRISLDGTYSLYDGGLKKAQIVHEQATLQIQTQSVAVELHRLCMKINRPFFAILLLRQHVKILDAARDDLLNRSRALEGAVKAGARPPGDIERLQLQILKIEGESEKTRFEISGWLSALEALTGEKYAGSIVLLAPEPPDSIWLTTSKRPELSLFQLQQQQVLASRTLAEIQNKPRVAAFLQAGIGYPNPLNFFEDQLSPFAVGGLQLTWKITGREQTQRDQTLLDIQARIVENQKAQFIQQVNAYDGKFREDYLAIKAIIRNHEAIALQQEHIRQQSAAQLALGVLSMPDYLADVHSALQTTLQLETYRIQLRQLYADYLTNKGIF
jgi:outer membrane protein TolC